MKVRIVCYEDLDLWILGKFARKLQIELRAIGVDCDIAKVPDTSADINHHIIYYYYDGQASTIDTVMVTHIDFDWKLQQVREQLKVAPMGICMSASTVQQLVNGGIPRERLSYVLPAHDQVMRPRPIVIGVTSKIHNDGRKREMMLVELADQISPEHFAFKIMGAGWNHIVAELRIRRFTVDYHESFDFELNQIIVPTFDYYLYLGLDEGAMGFIDALAAGVPTIATPQGYHLEAVNGITHPFITQEELVAVFTKIQDTRSQITNSVATWNWREYAIRHLEIWHYLRYGYVCHFSSEIRSDGISSVKIENGPVCMPSQADENRCEYTLGRKKILIACSHYWPSIGGLESRMGQLSAELVAAGYYTEVLTQTLPNRYEDTLNGVRIISSAPGDFANAIRKSVEFGDYDACILIQDPLGIIIWSVEGLKVPPNTRLIMQPIINQDGYSRWQGNPLFRERLANLLRLADTSLVMTKSGPDIKFMCEEQIKSIYLPNATKQVESAGDFRAKFSIPNEKFLILHVANLYWVKNHLALIDTLSDLPSSWQLVMIGNPTGESDCVASIEDKLNSRPDILFIPGLSREWISAAMQSADIIVLASLGEGSPITILEAMSHGKPWIATPECGAVNDHLGGIVCELTNFRAYLTLLSEFPLLLKTLGQVSYTHWKQCYSWPIVMRGWLEIIERGELSSQFVPDDLLLLQSKKVNLELAIKKTPANSDSYINIGLLLHSQGLHSEALEKFQDALVWDPANSIIFNNRGVCYFSLDLFEDAIQSYKKAISFDPRYVEAHNNLGNALVKLFQHEEALHNYDKALALDPGYVEAYWNKALALLQLGWYSEGWVLHESRWAKPSFQPIVRHFPQPIWDGSFSITGKTLLLHAEQGLGDTLQFVRYLELVLALGARVVLEVQAPLVPLLDGLFSVEALIKQGDPLPPFDCHCPLMSLPLAFQTTLTSVPSTVPYLKLSPEKGRFWAEKLGPTSQLRVGLVWSGDPRHQNDKHRSIPLAELMAALPPGCAYVSLQSETRDSDRQALENCDRLVHFGPELKDFSDTAALCAQMDVVVCVDTSAAHLSGALGKPTFLLLPYNPDWRWLLERTDSPWYPTMQLYRQAQLGSWQSALEYVSADLLGLEKRRFTT